jgi:hypothetical protein
MNFMEFLYFIYRHELGIGSRISSKGHSRTELSYLSVMVIKDEYNSETMTEKLGGAKENLIQCNFMKN